MKGFNFEIDELTEATYVVGLGAWTKHMVKKFMEAGFKYNRRWKCLECVIEYDNGDRWYAILDDRDDNRICMLNIYKTKNIDRFKSDSRGDFWVRLDDKNPTVYLAYLYNYVKRHRDKVEEQKKKALSFDDYVEKEKKTLKQISEIVEDKKPLFPPSEIVIENKKAEVVTAPVVVRKKKRFLGLF